MKVFKEYHVEFNDTNILNDFLSKTEKPISDIFRYNKDYEVIDNVLGYRSMVYNVIPSGTFQGKFRQSKIFVAERNHEFCILNIVPDDGKGKNLSYDEYNLIHDTFVSQVIKKVLSSYERYYFKEHESKDYFDFKEMLPNSYPFLERYIASPTPDPMDVKNWYDFICTMVTSGECEKLNSGILEQGLQEDFNYTPEEALDLVLKYEHDKGLIEEYIVNFQIKYQL